MSVSIASLTMVSGRCAIVLSVVSPLSVSGTFAVNGGKLVLQTGAQVSAGTLNVNGGTIVGSGTISSINNATLTSASLQPGFKASCGRCAASCTWALPSINYFGDIVISAPTVTVSLSEFFISFFDDTITFLRNPAGRSLPYDTITFSNNVAFVSGNTTVSLFYDNDGDVANGNVISWGQAFGVNNLVIAYGGTLQSYSVSAGVSCFMLNAVSGTTEGGGSDTGKEGVIATPSSCFGTGLSVVLGAGCPVGGGATTTTVALISSTSSGGAGGGSVDASTSSGGNAATTTTATGSVLSTGAIIGIAVGGAVGLGLLIAIAIAIPQMVSSYKTKQELKRMQEKIVSTVDL